MTDGLQNEPLQDLINENAALQRKNAALQQALDASRAPQKSWSDDTMDGFTWVVLIAACTAAVILFLSALPG